MDFDLSESEKAFRDEVRAWLKANAPRRDRPADSDTKAVVASRRAWQKKLYDAGYVGITWPKEYGGRGAGFMEQRRPAPRTRATTTWSMDRRFGPLSRMSRSGACW